MRNTPEEEHVQLPEGSVWILWQLDTTREGRVMLGVYVVCARIREVHVCTIEVSNWNGRSILRTLRRVPGSITIGSAVYLPMDLEGE